MSFHATTTPEAQAKLNTQRRNTSLSAFTIAILFCALIVATLFYIALRPLLKKEAPIVIYSNTTEKPVKLDPTIMSNEVEKRPASPSANRFNTIAVNTPSAIAITVTNTEMPPAINIGDGLDFGAGGGTGNGDGFNVNPSIPFMPRGSSKRCSKKDRLDRLIKEGGEKSYEDKVIASLRWLMKTQSSGGSWKAQGKPVAMTGRALLAYLGHCETPASPEFGETVQNAIIYPIKVSQKNGGKLASSITDKHWC